MTHKTRQLWTDADFDELSWHDNYVHGIQVEGGGEFGTGTLILDLDYILEWLRPSGQLFEFRIAPASLTFHDVFALKIDLDWIGAAMSPFSISQISRQKLPHESWSWSIGVNWPEGTITFEATGFTQMLRSEPLIKREQHLEANERVLR
jgi:hypothetical protein